MGLNRTGAVVGCLRKLCGWSVSVIFNEYLLFALPKARLEDQHLIEYFDAGDLTQQVAGDDD